MILFELLCGHLPFEGRNFGEFIVKHLTQPPPPAPPDVLRTAVGRTLDSVARRCLAKDPADRFASAAELKDIFDRMAAGERNLPGIGPGLLTSAVTVLGARSKLRLATGALAIAAAIGATVALWPRPPKVAFEQAPAPAPPPAPSRPKVVPLVPEHSVTVQFDSDPTGAETAT